MKFQANLNLALLLIVTLIIPQTAYSQHASILTDSDKAQIIETVLKEMLSISEEDRTRIILVPSKQPQPICQNHETEKVEYISTDNISESLLPKIPCVKFILLRSDEIEEKGRTGFSYLRFDKLKVKGSKFEVELSSVYQQGGFYSYSGIRYEYRRISGKWRGKSIGGYGGGN